MEGESEDGGWVTSVGGALRLAAAISVACEQDRALVADVIQTMEFGCPAEVLRRAHERRREIGTKFFSALGAIGAGLRAAGGAVTL